MSSLRHRRRGRLQSSSGSSSSSGSVAILAQGSGPPNTLAAWGEMGDDESDGGSDWRNGHVRAAGAPETDAANSRGWERPRTAWRQQYFKRKAEQLVEGGAEEHRHRRPRRTGSPDNHATARGSDDRGAGHASERGRERILVDGRLDSYTVSTGTANGVSGSGRGVAMEAGPEERSAPMYTDTETAETAMMRIREIVLGDALHLSLEDVMSRLAELMATPGLMAAVRTRTDYYNRAVAEVKAFVGTMLDHGVLDTLPPSGMDDYLKVLKWLQFTRIDAAPRREVQNGPWRGMT